MSTRSKQSVMFCCLLTAFVLIAGELSAQTWQWVKQGIADNKAEGRSIAVDNNKNVYVTGRYKTTLNLSGTTLTSLGGQDIFVVKYDSTGNLKWAATAGSADTGIDDEVEGIAVDNAGNVYITGAAAANAVFGSTTLPQNNFFLAKLNSDGDWEWARQGTGTYGSFGWDIEVDNAGNPYVALDFDVEITVGSNTFTATGGTYRDILLVKYDADGNGQWARQAGGDAYDRILDMCINSDAVYITGTFQGTASFGNLTLSSTSGDDVYLVKYDLEGNPVWARASAGGTSQSENSLFCTGTGSVLLAGLYNGTIQIGSTSLTSTTSQKDVFIARYTTDGTLVKAVNTGLTGTGDMKNPSVAADASGTVYLSGGLFGTLYGKTAKAIDIFLGVFNADLSNREAYITGANGIDIAKTIAVDPAGGIYLAGSFMQTVTFTGAGSLTGGNDLFTGKIFTSGTGIGSTPPQISCSIYPIPAQDHIWFKAANAGSYHLEVLDITGKVLKTASNISGSCKLNITALNSGYYFIRVSGTDNQQVTTRSFIKE